MEIFQNDGHEVELWKTCNRKGEVLKRISRGPNATLQVDYTPIINNESTYDKDVHSVLETNIYSY